MGIFSDIDRFHQTLKGRFIFGAAEILAAWVLIARAIDTGSLWQYLLVILLIIGGANNLVKALFQIGNKPHAKGRSKKR